MAVVTKEELSSEGCVDLESACEFLSVSMTTLYKLMNEGLPYTRVGGRRKIPRIALKRAVENNLHCQDVVSG